MSELERLAKEKVSEMQNTEQPQADKSKEPKIAYCHFAAYSPKGKNYGLFSCIISADKFGYRVAARKVMALELWEQQQYVTYCQSLWFALRCIWEWQGKMMNAGITNVMLVTNKTVLAKWIENPNKCKNYKKYMGRASADFKVGGKSEIILPVGLLQPMEERASKYCKMEFVDNPEDVKRFNGLIGINTINKLKVDTNNFKPIQVTNIEGLSDIKEI
jgi:hypothetical protein